MERQADAGTDNELRGYSEEFKTYSRLHYPFQPRARGRRAAAQMVGWEGGFGAGEDLGILWGKCSEKWWGLYWVFIAGEHWLLLQCNGPVEERQIGREDGQVKARLLNHRCEFEDWSRLVYAGLMDQPSCIFHRFFSISFLLQKYTFPNAISSWKLVRESNIFKLIPRNLCLTFHSLHTLIGDLHWDTLSVSHNAPGMHNRLFLWHTGKWTITVPWNATIHFMAQCYRLSFFTTHTRAWESPRHNKRGRNWPAYEYRALHYHTMCSLKTLRFPAIRLIIQFTECHLTDEEKEWGCE